MIAYSIVSGMANPGRLPRLGLALRDPMRSASRAESLNRRSVKTTGILSEALFTSLTPCVGEFLSYSQLACSLQLFA
jgi:hypothetical protein